MTFLHAICKKMPVSQFVVFNESTSTDGALDSRPMK